MGTARPTAEMQTPEQHRERLHEIVKSARTVMLLSHGADHEISGRPMALIRTDDDTTMYLVSPIDSQEILEIDRECRVSISIQVNDAFAMFDGEARISQERALIDELWNDTWGAWFEGKDDPAIAILIIQPTTGTYWDRNLGAGLSYLYGVLHEPPSERPPRLAHTRDKLRH